MTDDDPPLLEVDGLCTHFETERGTVVAVEDLSFTIEAGETLGLVGESGAGKSTAGLSILRLIDDPGQIVDGEIRYQGRDLLEMSDQEIREIRGAEIAMIFQDPSTAFNPAYTIGTQIADVIKEHEDVSDAAARERVVSTLEKVGLPDPEGQADAYPHQLSGGMRQRALIAMMIACNPKLLIADEPTTSLDVTIQAQILDLLADLQEEYGMAIQLITHDIAVIAEMCERVAVMYAGKKVEEGPTAEVLGSPKHPYTVGLLNARPVFDDSHDQIETIPGTMPDLIDKPNGCSFRPRCPHATEECAVDEPPLIDIGENEHQTACVRTDDINFDEEATPRTTDATGENDVGATNDANTVTTANQGGGGGDVTEAAENCSSDPLITAEGLRKYFTPESESWYDRILGERKFVHAVDDVSLQINEGETFALVGESGCGKTTLGRTLMQLYEPDEGNVLYAGSDLTDMNKRQLREARSDLQVVFQDPFSSLNPRHTVEYIIGRPLEIHGHVDSKAERHERVIELLEEVGLDPSHADRYAHEFSGGQKQRIGIARALAVEPEFIVADEPVSALDVSVQAKIINLLTDLQERYGLTYLFISHDMNVVQHIADRIGVMYLGELVEVGTAEQVLEPPHHPYTEMLLSSVPRSRGDELTDRVRPEGEPPSPTDPPSGCRFHTRCPHAVEACENSPPSTAEAAEDHVINCHLYDPSVVPVEENPFADSFSHDRASDGETGHAVDEPVSTD